MVEEFWTSRRCKAGIIGLAMTILIVVVMAFSINSILSPIIGRKIKNAVIKSSDGLYQVSFKNLEINIFTGKVALNGIKLLPDTLLAHSAAKVYAGSAKALLITGLHPLAYVFHKKLEIEEITLIDPNVTLKINKAPKEEHNDTQTLYQKISRSLRLIHVDGIFLTHARLNYLDYRKSKPSVFHLKELSLRAYDLLIDSSTQRDTRRTLFCRDISTGIRNFSGFTDDGIYRYSLHAAYFSTQSQKLIVRGIILKPLPTSIFFAKSRADRFSFDLDSLVLAHFNYRSFMSDNSLEVKKLSAFKGGISIFSNPNGVLPKTDRVITFPNYIIRTLQTHFTVDTLDITGFAVNYTELNKQPGKTGTLTFTNTKARFLNISNESKKLSHNGFCTAQLSTMFMGKGKLDLSFVFNLTDKVYAYSYSGHLAPMPINAVNPVLMPLALVKIKSGELKSLDFAIKSDQKKSTGSLHLLYNDLDIDLLNRDYHSKVIKTFLANTLVIKRDNPDSGSILPRFAKVVFIRPKSYPFFKTLWETLLSGIKPCAGLGYAVKPEQAKPLSKKEQKAKDKALKKALKAKKKADKQHQKDLKKQGRN